MQYHHPDHSARPHMLGRRAGLVAAIVTVAALAQPFSSRPAFSSVAGAARADDTRVPAALSYPVQVRLAMLTGQAPLPLPDLTWQQLQTMVGSVATDGAMVNPNTGLPWDLETLLARAGGATQWLTDKATTGALTRQMLGAVNQLSWRLAHPTPTDNGGSFGSGYLGTSGLDYEDLERGAHARTIYICTQNGIGDYHPEQGLVLLWKALYYQALGGSQTSDGSLGGGAGGSNAYEAGSNGINYAYVNVERSMFQAQLPQPGQAGLAYYLPIDGVRVDEARVVLYQLLPTVYAGDVAHGYVVKNLTLTASEAPVAAGKLMTNADFNDPMTTAGTVHPSLYNSQNGFYKAEFPIALNFLLQPGSDPLHPVFRAALRVRTQAQEPPPGFPDSVPPFNTCGWAAEWLMSFLNATFIYHEDLSRVEPIRVSLPQHIRNLDSPTAMKDRIPPRVDTPEEVSVSYLPAGVSIQLSAIGPSGEVGTGTATVDGQQSLDLTADGTREIKLRGIEQTAPAKTPADRTIDPSCARIAEATGPKLRLEATLGGTVLAESAPFAVSAIPERFSDELDAGLSGTFTIPGTKPPQTIEVSHGEMVGKWRGIVVLEKFQSDSHEVSDLNCTQQTELARATNGPPTATSGYLPGDRFLPDFLGTLVSTIAPGYKQQVNQVHLFNDLRSESYNISTSHSGYAIRRDADAKGETFTTCKDGEGELVTGFITGTQTKVKEYSQAGEPAGLSNAICKTQKVH